MSSVPDELVSDKIKIKLYSGALVHNHTCIALINTNDILHNVALDNDLYCIWSVLKVLGFLVAWIYKA